jgi:hypothetical protein
MTSPSFETAPADARRIIAGFKSSDRCIVQARAVADDLPSKEGAHLPQSVRLVMTKHDDVLGVEAHDEVIAVTPKSHQQFRTLATRGQLNLIKIAIGVSKKPRHIGCRG